MIGFPNDLQRYTFLSLYPGTLSESVFFSNTVFPVYPAWSGRPMLSPLFFVGHSIALAGSLALVPSLSAVYEEVYLIIKKRRMLKKLALTSLALSGFMMAPQKKPECCGIIGVVSKKPISEE